MAHTENLLKRKRDPGVESSVGREEPDNRSMVDALPQVQFERELMVGSIGTLWLGRLMTGSEAGRTVLLRRMPLDLFTSKDVDSLAQVAQAYSKVRHPSLVKLLGLVEQDRDLLSVSEHLDGVRLGDLLRSAVDCGVPLPATVALRIVLDAARATMKAHRLAGDLGLYPAHRLFMPEGVFVAAFGGTLLTEIGVLSAIARFSLPRTVPDLLAQLAPEEIEKSTPSKGSPEVFSLGVVLWETLANRLLFTRDSVSQTTNEVLHRPIEPLNGVERCGMPVPEALAEVVATATQRDPSQRYATLEEFVSAIEQLPAHFIATEHHVASALRNQAATLLQALHVDPSQASLTVAFSEVPASRMSTRPPPDGHDWDPPTFNQSRLVSGGPRALGLPHELESHAEPLRGIVPVTSAVPFTTPRRSRRKRAAWIALSVLSVGGLLVSLLVRTSRSNEAAIAPEPTRTVAPKLAEPEAPSRPAIANTAESNTVPTSVPPQASSATTPRATLRKDSSDATAATAEPEPLGTTAPKRSGGAYRPRQIAPFRPKGI